jgi:hypothetical protein
MRRIRAVPRRQWEPDQAQALADHMTRALAKTPNPYPGPLYPAQAIALWELAECGGLFAPLPVGGGKTLVALLAPYMLGSVRPLLVVRAALEKKMRRKMVELAEHWPIPNFIRITTYEALGRVSAKTLLDEYRPDSIICDEAHRIKNPRAAVTIQISGYMNTHTECKYVDLSGTPGKISVTEFAPRLRWAQRFAGGFPLPNGADERKTWAAVLDEKEDRNGDRRPMPGALLTLAGPEDMITTDKDGNQWQEHDPYTIARRAWGRRFHQTKGVVVTTDDPHAVGASLLVQSMTLPKRCPAIEAHLRELRATWERPDGWAFAEAPQVWACARQLALGFYYKWKQTPPPEWIEARRAWAKYVRQQINAGRVQSELDCAQTFPDALQLTEWQAIKDQYKHETECVWISGEPLKLCADWLAQNDRGICWVAHRYFGEALSYVTGRPYFREEAHDAQGNYVEDASGPIILSIQAGREGLDLQFKWDTNLITAPMSGADDWEQLLARTHRRGQDSDTVSAYVFTNCDEHVASMQSALALSTAFSRDTLHAKPKLLYCDLDLLNLWPSQIAA